VNQNRLSHFFAALSMMLSLRRAFKSFGILVVLSFGAAYYFYAIRFISVWCFFAALLSVLFNLHFRSRSPLLKEVNS
jgi:hypothetical protein